VNDVVVVGAGVSGLSTAILLAEGGLAVRIIAREGPLETTSSVAAAVWYPYRAYPEDLVLAWGERTFAIFTELIGVDQAGVRLGELKELFLEPVADPWWAAAVPSIRRCTATELPDRYHDGLVFTTPVVEMPRYLGYLTDRFAAAGGRIERRAVGSLEEAANDARVLVNCAGLGARDLVGDGSLLPVRGQVVVVANPGLAQVIIADEAPDRLTYIVPRTGDVVLGGTAEEGATALQPDAGTAAAILRRCSVLEPRLADAEVLAHKVGLRPARPAVRLEATALADGTPCVHNYGHGGAGVTLSWGCAQDAADLARRYLAR
jgi:D-amino-acid oxidase